MDVKYAQGLVHSILKSMPSSRIVRMFRLPVMTKFGRTWQCNLEKNGSCHTTENVAFHQQLDTIHKYIADVNNINFKFVDKDGNTIKQLKNLNAKIQNTWPPSLPDVPWHEAYHEDKMPHVLQNGWLDNFKKIIIFMQLYLYSTKLLNDFALVFDTYNSDTSVPSKMVFLRVYNTMISLLDDIDIRHTNLLTKQVRACIQSHCFNILVLRVMLQGYLVNTEDKHLFMMLFLKRIFEKNQDVSSAFLQFEKSPYGNLSPMYILQHSVEHLDNVKEPKNIVQDAIDEIRQSPKPSALTREQLNSLTIDQDNIDKTTPTLNTHPVLDIFLDGESILKIKITPTKVEIPKKVHSKLQINDINF